MTSGESQPRPPLFAPPPVLKRPAQAELSLPKRKPRSPEASVGDAKLSAVSDVSETAPLGPLVGIQEWEKTLRLLEAKLDAREREITELETRLAERMREVAETEALVAARQALLVATRRAPPGAGQVASPEERVAMERLRAELERREGTLKELLATMAEREKFLEQSEARLLHKVQSQQEKETELEQREEELLAWEKRLKGNASETGGAATVGRGAPVNEYQS